MAESAMDSHTGAGTVIALESVFDVFLSYNRSDKYTVKNLAHALLQNGLKPWLDEWNLIPGAPWQPEIEKVLKKCRSVAVLIGPSGLSPWQSEEMRAAINRRVQETNGLFRLIPVLLPGASRDVVANDFQFLSATTWVEFTDSIDDEEHVHRLVCGIRGLEPGEWPAGAAGKQRSSRYFFIVDGTVEQLDKAKIESIVELLRKYSGDASLTLREINDGSIKMLIDGARIGYDRLLFLFRTGQLTHVLDMQVQGLTLLSDQASSRSTDSGSGSPPASQGTLSSSGGPGTASSPASKPRSTAPVKVNPIPQGYHTVTAYLCVNDGRRAIEFYKKAFGAQELTRMEVYGKIAHAEIKIGDSVIMLSEEMPGGEFRSPQALGGTTARVLLYVKDVDTVYTNAVAAGATPTMPPADMFWGDRYGKVVDPFGHSWSLATHKEDVAPEEMTRRAEAQMEQQRQSRTAV
jgi:PhnB protein